MTLGIPVWEGRVSPVFDVARHLLTVDVERGVESDRRERAVSNSSPHGWPATLAELGVDVLVCGAISDEILAALTRGGVGVVPWIRGEVDQVVSAYLSGELSDPRFLVPGTVPHAGVA